MRHSFTSPTDSDLENLIKQAFEAMPGADQSRLSFIESQVLQKAAKLESRKKLNLMPWWIVLLLGTGVVSAAWLVSDIIFHENPGDTKEVSVTVDREPVTVVQDIDKKTVIQRQEEQSNEEQLYNDRESAIIYQRESY
jgi:cytoskeletal protein RodZ